MINLKETLERFIEENPGVQDSRERSRKKARDMEKDAEWREENGIGQGFTTDKYESISIKGPPSLLVGEAFLQALDEGKIVGDLPLGNQAASFINQEAHRWELEQRRERLINELRDVESSIEIFRLHREGKTDGSVG